MQLSLKSARVNKGFTQEEAATKLGISPYTLANYENGKTFPDVPVIQKIEELYGIEYKDIFFSVGITV